MIIAPAEYIEIPVPVRGHLGGVGDFVLAKLFSACCVVGANRVCRAETEIKPPPERGNGGGLLQAFLFAQFVDGKFCMGGSIPRLVQPSCLIHFIHGSPVRTFAP